MDIMEDNGEIWWKYSVPVMVYIYFITADDHFDPFDWELSQDFVLKNKSLILLQKFTSPVLF